MEWLSIIPIGIFTGVLLWVIAEISSLKNEMERLQHIARLHTEALYGSKNK